MGICGLGVLFGGERDGQAIKVEVCDGVGGEERSDVQGGCVSWLIVEVSSAPLHQHNIICRCAVFILVPFSPAGETVVGAEKAISPVEGEGGGGFMVEDFYDSEAKRSEARGGQGRGGEH